MFDDPLAETPLAAAELPDGLTGFGQAEFAFLASVSTAPPAAVSREFLGVEKASDEVALLGASGLFTRGWLAAGDDRTTEARSYGALLEIVLSTATRWTRLGALAVDDEPGLAFIVTAPTVMALIEPSQLGTHWVRFGSEPEYAAQLAADLVESRLDAAAGTPILVTSRGLDAPPTTLLVQRDGAGVLTARRDVNVATGAGADALGEDGLLEALAQIMDA